MANKTIKSTGRSKGAVSNEEIKTKLYEVLSDIFSARPLAARGVARDFSDSEADNFINAYYSYLVK